MAFTPILYESEEVGKRVKSSKVKHSWMLEISGKPFTVEFFDSRRSKKARIVLNEVEVFKGKRQGGEVNVPFRMGTLSASVVAKGAMVDLSIGSRYFKHVWAEVQAAPVPQYEEFEQDFPDDPPVLLQPQRPVKEPQRPPKPAVPEPKPEPKPVAKPVEKVKVPEVKVTTTDLLSEVFDGPVNPYPSVLDSPFPQVEKARPSEQAAPPQASASYLIEEDSMIGETIRVKPSTTAPQPQPPVQSVPPTQVSGQMALGLQPAPYPGQVPWPMMQGQMPAMMGVPNMPQYYSQQPGMVAPGMSYAPQSFATGYPQPAYSANPATFASQGPAAISSGLDFFSPHAGLIDGTNVRLAKNDRFAPEAKVLQIGNPFADQKPDQSCVSDPNMLDLVDLNLANPYTPAQHRQYKEHMRGVEVKGSDPDVPMKDLQKRGANNPFGQPAQGDFF